MTRAPLRRLVSLVSVSLLAAMALGVGPVNAQNPSWYINITPTPATVGAGHDSGFIVTVGNNGPSNINDLRVIVTPTDLVPLNATADDPTHLSTLAYAINGTPVTGPQNCISLRPLTCLLGTLVDDESVTFTVAYAVPSDLKGNFDINVAIRAGTGDPSGKNNSRGDAFDKSSFATIASGDSDAGFVVGADVYQTNPILGNRNVQSTGLSGAPQLVPVTITDGPDVTTPCDPLVNTACSSVFGEWSRLNVNNGNGGVNFATPFKVTLVIRGSAVSGGVAASDIQVVHVLDNGTIQVVDQTCTFSGTDPIPTNAECLVATKVGSNWKIEVWLLKNGYARGGI